MKDRYDVVIIGAGIGGLVSAALLSNIGKKILIVEKEPGPGGYLTEFSSDGFFFDVSLHLLNGCGKEQNIYDIFRRCQIIDKIKFLKPKYLYRGVFPDYDIRVPQTDILGYAETLKGLFPDSTKGIDAVFTISKDVFEMVNSKRTNSKLLPYIRGNFDSIINKHIHDDKLKAIICQPWLYFGLPPSMLRAVDFCYPMYDYLNNGGYYLEKGSYGIVTALHDQIISKGGKFLFNKTVGKISLNNDAHNKVVFGRDSVTCEKIISNIDLTETLFGLIGKDNIPPATIEKVQNIEPSISAFEVFLALDIDMKKIYPNDYEIFIASDYDVDKQYRDSLNNNARTAPFVVTINSNVNRFSAPEGSSVITLIMLSGYKYWASVSKNEYEDKKEIIADILIERAAKVVSEIKAHIIKKIISTPLTFLRYTGNSGGAIYGYSRTLGRSTEVRPNMMKELKNIYFASAWANHGSGVAKVLRSADTVYNLITNENIRAGV